MKKQIKTQKTILTGFELYKKRNGGTCPTISVYTPGKFAFNDAFFREYNIDCAGDIKLDILYNKKNNSIAFVIPEVETENSYKFDSINYINCPNFFKYFDLDIKKIRGRYIPKQKTKHVKIWIINLSEKKELKKSGRKPKKGA